MGLGDLNIKYNLTNCEAEIKRLWCEINKIKTDCCGSGGGSGVENDPIALAKTITINSGTGVSIAGAATQTIGSNPVYTISATPNVEGTQDLVGLMLLDTPTIDLTYQDNLGKISADLIVGAVDNTLENFLVWDSVNVKQKTLASIIEDVENDIINNNTFLGDLINNLFQSFNVNDFYTTSSDCIEIPEIHPTQITMTVGTNLSYQTGDEIIVYANATHYFTATVVSYDSSTGELIIDSVSNVGTGLFCSWTVNLASLFGLSTIVTEDTLTVDHSGGGTLADPLRSDVIIGDIDNTAPNLVVWSGTELKQRELSTIIGNDAIVYGGRVTWTGVGFIYDIEETGYYLNGIYYVAPANTVTLDPADPSCPRLDTFIVDTSATSSALTGDPSCDVPTEYPLDIGTQLRLDVALVLAGTTEPVLGTECLYLDNAEWTSFSSTVRIDVNSTTNPCSGTKSIKAVNVVTNDYFTLTNSSTLIPAAYNQLSFSINSTGAWGNKKLSFRWYNGATPVGNPVTFSHNSYGFSSSSTGFCQSIVIPMTDFGLNLVTLADNLRVTVTNSSGSFSWFMDTICITANMVGTPPVNLLFNNGLTRTGNTIQLGGSLLHDTQVWTQYSQMQIWGQRVFDSVLDVGQYQDFETSADIQSWHHRGSLTPGDSSYLTTVKKRLSYTGDRYYAIGPDEPSYFGDAGDREGYYDSINIYGQSSTGLYEDMITSKWSAQFWNTHDTDNTELISWFGGQPDVDGLLARPAALTHVGAFRLFTIHTTGQLEAPKYGVATFLDNSAPYILATTADGHIVELDPATITGTGGTVIQRVMFQVGDATYPQDGDTDYVNVGLIDNAFNVYLEGELLYLGLDYTYDNSTGTITFTPDLIEDERVEIDIFGTFVPTYTFTKSVINTAGVVTLVNDEATPTDGKFYGKIGGVKGWYTPAGSSSMRFGFSGEDDTAGEVRSFDVNANDFHITDGANDRILIQPTFTVFQQGDTTYVGGEAEINISGSTFNAQIYAQNATGNASSLYVNPTSIALYPDSGNLYLYGLTSATAASVLYFDGTKVTYGAVPTANSFVNIAVSGQSTVIADSSTDTLTLANGTGIDITTNSSTDTITITNTGIVTASNGLTLASSNVKLGGTLINDTVIDQTDKSFTLSNSDGSYLISNPAGNLWAFGNGSDFGTCITINDGPGGGGTNNYLKIVQNGVRVLSLDVINKQYILGNQDGGGGTILTINDLAQTITLAKEIHFSNYGTGANTGILTKILGVTSGGKVIEVTGSVSGTNTGDQNIFQTIAVAGQSNVVADSTTDTLTLIAGSGVVITTNATNDEITISATSGGGGTVTDFIFTDGNGFDGTVSTSTTTPTLSLTTTVTDDQVMYSNSGAIVGNANLTFDDTLLSLLAASLGTTQSTTKGFKLYNNTAAAAGAQQISPAIYWNGKGWKTTATAASQDVSFRSYVLPIEGTSNPYAAWQLQYSINGGGYSNVIVAKSNGGIEFNSGSVSATAGDYSIANHGSTIDGVGSYAFSHNAVNHGDNCFIGGGENFVIDDTVGGAVAMATDGRIYAGAHYAFVANDANEAWGESSSTFGFGNDNFDDNAIVGGSGNVAGSLSAGGGTSGIYSNSFIFGLNNRTTGNRAFAMGRVARATADDAWMFGTGVDATNTPIVNSEAESFAVGFNSTVPTFIVHKATGAGTFGQTEAAGTIKIGSISNDNTEVNLVVWNSTDKVLEYRTVSSLSIPSTSGHVVQENGSNLTQRANLNFDEGLLATDDAGNSASKVVIVGYDQWRNATVNTTSVTTTTLATITLPATGRGILVVDMAATESTGGNGLTGTKYVHWKSVSGTATVLQVVGQEADYLDGWTTGTWTVDANSGNLRIRVTADTTSSTDWNAAYQLKYNTYTP